MTIRVLVNGANGRMGQEAVKAINQSADFALVGIATKTDDLAQTIKKTQPQIVIDFTTAAVAYDNARIIIENNIRPVIGTTGFKPEQIQDLIKRCTEKKLGGIIAPNFSIAAILMMKYAQDCAHYFPHVEIIELHHDQKVDAPSGTAIKTAELIAEIRTKPNAKVNEKELLAGARGANKNDVHIHSIRLPGLVAHQEVIFGSNGETFTIRHDMLNREAAMPGVLLACKKVLELNTLVYGLEKVL